MTTKYSFPLLDVTEVVANFNVPGLDYKALVEAQRKSLHALTAANDAAAHAMQQLGTKQVQIFRETFNRYQDAARSLMSDEKDPKKRIDVQAQIAKEAFEEAISNMKELAAITIDAQTKAMDLITEQFRNGINGHHVNGKAIKA